MTEVEVKPSETVEAGASHAAEAKVPSGVAYESKQSGAQEMKTRSQTQEAVEAAQAAAEEENKESLESKGVKRKAAPKKSKAKKSKRKGKGKRKAKNSEKEKEVEEENEEIEIGDSENVSEPKEKIETPHSEKKKEEEKVPTMPEMPGLEPSMGTATDSKELMCLVLTAYQSVRKLFEELLNDISSGNGKVPAIKLFTELATLWNLEENLLFPEFLKIDVLKDYVSQSVVDHITLKKEVFGLNQITLNKEEWYKDETFILGLQKLQKEMLERIQLETDTILPKFVERFIDVAMACDVVQRFLKCKQTMLTQDLKSLLTSETVAGKHVGKCLSEEDLT